MDTLKPQTVTPPTGARVIRLFSKSKVSTPARLARAKRYYDRHADQERARAKRRYSERKHRARKGAGT